MSTGAPSKAVLITGCSSGIGRATALRLASRGFIVYATARKTAAIDDLAASGCRTLPLDVTDAASMEGAVRAIEAEHGAVGILVNNAGYGQSGAFESVPLEKVRAQLETNVFGLVKLTQLVLPGMRAQGFGRIVNIGSMGGKLTFPGAGFYHATKYAVEALSDALRFELRGFGIRVVLIEPGLIVSSFGDAALSSLADAASEGPYAGFDKAVGRLTEEAYRKGPLSMLAGTPGDVAKVIERAISRKRPRARYTVSPSATLLLTLRRVLPDSVWDAFLGFIYPRPGSAI